MFQKDRTMGDMEDQEDLDPKVSARLLRHALTIAGGREKLADWLGVGHSELARWMAAQVFPSHAAFEKVLELVLDEHEIRLSARSHSDFSAVGPGDAIARESASKPRILLADVPEGCAAVSNAIRNDFEVELAFTRTDAIRILHREQIDLIVCGQQFEDSQMLRFLEHVKANERTRHIPFICCRSVPTSLREVSMRAMREACEALGAVAYVDFSERERAKGREAAAVEFRDAVTAAIRFQPNTRSLRILVADDNPDAAHTLGTLLEMAGHTVQRAKNGTEALTMAAAFRPRVAVLDVGMPGLSGYSVAAKIRSQPWGEEITLIALTGYAAREHVAKALRSGFDYHFKKPVKVEYLVEVFPA